MRAEILEKITGNKNLLKVNLAGLKITDNEILEIIKKVKEVKPSVSKIDLDNNQLSDEGAKLLSEELRDFNNITEISVQFNNIGRDGALELFSLKKVFSELDILFHGNKITDVSEMDEIERQALEEAPSPK